MFIANIAPFRRPGSSFIHYVVANKEHAAGIQCPEIPPVEFHVLFSAVLMNYGRKKRQIASARADHLIEIPCDQFDPRQAGLPMKAAPLPVELHLSSQTELP